MIFQGILSEVSKRLLAEKMPDVTDEQIAAVAAALRLPLDKSKYYCRMIRREQNEAIDKLADTLANTTEEDSLETFACLLTGIAAAQEKAFNELCPPSEGGVSIKINRK
jgi:Arc/MetJ family transcription regulator